MCKAAKVIKNRLKEPSTMAGLAVIGTAFGVPAEATMGVANVVAAGAAVLAVMLPEKAKAH